MNILKESFSHTLLFTQYFQYKNCMRNKLGNEIRVYLRLRQIKLNQQVHNYCKTEGHVIGILQLAWHFPFPIFP